MAMGKLPFLKKDIFHLFYLIRLALIKNKKEVSSLAYIFTDALVGLQQPFIPPSSGFRGESGNYPKWPSNVKSPYSTRRSFIP